MYTKKKGISSSIFLNLLIYIIYDPSLFSLICQAHFAIICCKTPSAFIAVLIQEITKTDNA